jgi:uncharacterized membrane protein YgcG
MKRRDLVRRWPGIVVLVLAMLAMAGAWSVPAMAAEDAPARAVRLSSVNGPVQISHGDEVLADQALANTPLFEGTRVATSDEGRAEIQFEDGSVVRLSPGSSITLAVLRQQDGAADAEIEAETGLVYFELQGESQTSHIRVKFSDGVITASGFSVLRIDLDNPPGELAVFSGNAHLERANSLALDLHGGESVALNATDLSAYNLAESIEPDSWDAWNADLDQALTAEAAARTKATSSFANNNNPAWSDLDANGNWYNVPGAGYVWSPYEAGGAGAGWDPYGCGHWAYTPRFGYVWVSCSSWGYMPFQCGAWNYYSDFGWGWAPGMGGCQPWWGRGAYGYNVGLTPVGYRLPSRPGLHQPARLPWNGGGGGKPGRPHPVISVDRRSSVRPAALAARDKNAPVVIAGHTVQPLHPLSPRPTYQRPASGYLSRTQPAMPGARMPGVPGRPASPIAGGRNPSAPGVNNGVRSGYPSSPNGNSQHAQAPSHTYSGGGSASHSSAASGGSSSGGGSHSGGGSFGGGGSSGGGGGSHGGGGGGGGGGSGGGKTH